MRTWLIRGLLLAAEMIVAGAGGYYFYDGWRSAFIAASLAGASALIIFGLRRLYARYRGSIGSWLTSFRSAPATPPTTTPTSSDPHDAESKVVGHTWLYLAALVALVAGFFYLGLAFEGHMRYIIWVSGIWYLASGFRVIGPEEYVGVQLLGKPTIVVTGGPLIVPPLLFTETHLPRRTQQMELPDEPERIFRDDHDKAVPDGMIPPIRVTFAQGTASGSGATDDPLEQRLTAEVSPFVRFRIRDFWTFFVRIGDMQEARRQLSDLAISELQTRLAQLTVAQALKDKSNIDKELDNLIRTESEKWGIEIATVGLKLFGIPKRVNESIANVAKAVADKRKTVIDADAKSYELATVGEGEGKATKHKLDGETDGLVKRATDLKVAGADVLGARIAEAMGTSPSSKIILGADELIKAGKKFADSFTKP